MTGPALRFAELVELHRGDLEPDERAEAHHYPPEARVGDSTSPLAWNPGLEGERAEEAERGADDMGANAEPQVREGKLRVRKQQRAVHRIAETERRFAGRELEPFVAELDVSS